MSGQWKCSAMSKGGGCTGGASAERRGAAGNFFPYDRCLHLLVGNSLWDKYLFWTEHLPRGARDERAMAFLRNMDLAAQARVCMKKEQAAAARRFQMKTTSQEQRSHPVRGTIGPLHVE